MNLSIYLILPTSLYKLSTLNQVGKLPVLNHKHSFSNKQTCSLSSILYYILIKKPSSKFLEVITVMRMCHFRMYQNGPFVLVQIIIITFIYLLAISIVQNLKKFLQQIQNYDMCHLGSK